MYLSRLTLNARHNRTKSEIDRPYELHRTICKAWEDPEAARVLSRIDLDQPGVVNVIVQSLVEPDWSRLAAPRDYLLKVDGPKPFDLQGLREGQILRFRLRCRPTKRLSVPGRNQTGPRVALTERQEIFGWLHRKAQLCGFKVNEAAFDRVYWNDSKNGVSDKPLGAVVFNGILSVTEPEVLREAVRNGIGTQKAFGFGLLSLASANGR